MKTWEEEWMFEDDILYRKLGGNEWTSISTDFDSPDRARLAAQAPAQARLLKAWSEGCSCESAHCFDCDATRVLRDAGVLP